MNHLAVLTAAWSRAVAGVSGPAERVAADRLVGEVLSAYREPHRRYHDIRHVAWTVHHVDTLAASEPVIDLGAVVMAAFFHDTVYELDRSDNEARSATYARRTLPELGWDGARIERVAAMVEATAHLLPAAADATDGADGGAHSIDADTAVLLDADLAVLGADPAGYQAYATAVRHEYASVDDASWRTGRATVLREFLSRDRLYRTPTALARWNDRAHANLTAELATLER